jgi:hypothetical protein
MERVSKGQRPQFRQINISPAGPTDLVKRAREASRFTQPEDVALSVRLVRLGSLSIAPGQPDPEDAPSVGMEAQDALETISRVLDENEAFFIGQLAVSGDSEAYAESA